MADSYRRRNDHICCFRATGCPVLRVSRVCHAMQEFTALAAYSPPSTPSPRRPSRPRSPPSRASDTGSVGPGSVLTDLFDLWELLTPAGKLLARRARDGDAQANSPQAAAAAPPQAEPTPTAHFQMECQSPVVAAVLAQEMEAPAAPTDATSPRQSSRVLAEPPADRSSRGSSSSSPAASRGSPSSSPAALRMLCKPPVVR